MNLTSVEILRCRLLFCTVGNNPVIKVLQCSGGEYDNKPVELETYTLSANTAVSMKVLDNSLITEYTNPAPPLPLPDKNWLQKGIATTAKNTAFFWLKNLAAVQHGVEIIFYGTEDLRPCYGRPVYRVAIPSDGIILLRDDMLNFSIYYPDTSQLIKRIEYDYLCP